MRTNKKTKIVCTLGPASEDIEIIEKMVKAGMNVARLNFSHGTYGQFEKIIKNIRFVSKKLNVPIAIIQDLQGPKIRTKEIPAEGISIKKGEEVIISTEKNHKKLEKNVIKIDYSNLHKDVKKNDMILIDDGLIELRIKKIQGKKIYCMVENDGIIKNKKGVNVPTAQLGLEPLTEKDRKDLEFGLHHDVDYVALSFVRYPEDILHLRKIIKNAKSTAAQCGETKIMAKIERREAVENLEKIVKVSDAIMIARGDLGIEIPAENVPIVQKQAIILANTYGKPVITATHILNSMIENPRATRAEISDAANAIFDHSDALMLSNETAVGKYPVEAVETLARVADSTEKNLEKYGNLLPFKRNRLHDIPISNATCLNAAEMACDIKAAGIVAVSMSGFTAQHIAKYRLYIPLVIITSSEKIRNQLSLVWGCSMIFVEKINLKKIIPEVANLLRKNKLVKKGDEIVIAVNASKKQKLISTIVIQ